MVEELCGWVEWSEGTVAARELCQQVVALLAVSACTDSGMGMGMGMGMTCDKETCCLPLQPRFRRSHPTQLPPHLLQLRFGLTQLVCERVAAGLGVSACGFLRVCSPLGGIHLHTDSHRQTQTGAKALTLDMPIKRALLRAFDAHKPNDTPLPNSA